MGPDYTEKPGWQYVPWDTVEYYYGQMWQVTDGTATPHWLPPRDVPQGWTICDEGTGWWYRFGLNTWAGPFERMEDCAIDAAEEVSIIREAKAEAAK
jgi:hypothetical protein